MRINNKRFEEFNMKANSFAYQPLSISTALFQPESSIYPIVGDYMLKPKQMELIAEFRSKLDISNLMAEILMHKENTIDIKDGYIYKCYFNGSTTPVSEYWQGWYRVTLPFLVIQTGFEHVITLRDIKNYVDVEGNWKAPCIYEITPQLDLDSIHIAGMRVNKLYTNRLLTVDGVLKKVYTKNEPNKYGDCTFLNNKFPTLTPGKNIIEISTADVKVKLRYSPIYV